MSPSCGADPERGTQNDADLDHDADPGLGGGDQELEKLVRVLVQYVPSCLLCLP